MITDPIINVPQAGGVRALRVILSLTVMVTLVSAVLLTTCGGDDDDDSVALTLTSEDDGGSFEVEQGETLVIELDSNPTTGFEWAVDDVDTDVLTYTGSEYQPEDDGLVGQGGTQRLSFQAASPGSSVIELKYWRSWEGDNSIDQRFSVTIDVDG